MTKLENLKNLKAICPGGILYSMEEHQVIVNRKEKPNTFEIGRAGKRHTIAYDKVEELDAQIKSLRALGYLDEEFN